MEVILAIAAIIVIFALLSASSSRRNKPPSPPTDHQRTVLSEPKPKPKSPTRNSRAQHPKIIEGPAYVTDGDGLRIKGVKLRLFGIDAPEHHHPFGKKAKWELVRLCKGQKVRAELQGTDDHGRQVAHCFLEDGRDLSAEMVKLGLALDWAKFSGGVYRSLEVADARKRLWLADARQKGRIHIWDQFESKQAERQTKSAASK